MYEISSYVGNKLKIYVPFSTNHHQPCVGKGSHSVRRFKHIRNEEQVNSNAILSVLSLREVENELIKDRLSCPQNVRLTYLNVLMITPVIVLLCENTKVCVDKGQVFKFDNSQSAALLYLLKYHRTCIRIQRIFIEVIEVRIDMLPRASLFGNEQSPFNALLAI